MPLMARGYTAGPDGVRPAMLIHMSVPHAAGALIGSVEDLARWAQALHHGGVVDAAGYARMIAPTTMPSGDAAPYGFGLRLGEVRGRRAIEHGGGIFGASTESVYLPDQNLFVAVFANSDSPAGSPGLTARRLAALALGDPYPTFERAALDPTAVEPFLGVYTLPNGAGERRFFVRDGKLFTQRSGGNELEAFAAGGGRYFYGAESLTWFRLERDAAGAMAMLMYKNGEPAAERSVRAGPIPPEAAAVAVPRETLAALSGLHPRRYGTVTIALADEAALPSSSRGSRLSDARDQPDRFMVDAVSARVISAARRTVTRLVHPAGRARAAGDQGRGGDGLLSGGKAAMRDPKGSTGRHEKAPSCRRAGRRRPRLRSDRPPGRSLNEIADQVSEGRLKADVERLVGFGTRHTLSSRDHPTRGLGALNWTESEFRRISRGCRGCLEVVRTGDTVTGRASPSDPGRKCRRHPARHERPNDVSSSPAISTAG